MKILKIFGLLLGVAIALFLIAGLFVPKDFHFEKSKEMAVSKDKVWDNIKTLRNHDKWSQWRVLDPNMKIEYKGVDGAVGSSMDWTSNHDQVGNGKQTITNVVDGERIDSKVEFDGRGEVNSYLFVQGDSTSSKVTWGIEMHADYPFNTFAAMMGEKMMVDMFDKGFQLLDKASKE
jgi:hypothetical protein